jgi:hypothetical protein
MADFRRQRAFLPLSVGSTREDGHDMTLFVLLSGLVLLAVAASRWGADSRDGRDWQPQTYA